MLLIGLLGQGLPVLAQQGHGVERGSLNAHRLFRPDPNSPLRPLAQLIIALTELIELDETDDGVRYGRLHFGATSSSHDPPPPERFGEIVFETPIWIEDGQGNIVADGETTVVVNQLAGSTEVTRVQTRDNTQRTLDIVMTMVDDKLNLIGSVTVDDGQTSDTYFGGYILVDPEHPLEEGAWDGWNDEARNSGESSFLDETAAMDYGVSDCPRASCAVAVGMAIVVVIVIAVVC